MAQERVIYNKEVQTMSFEDDLDTFAAESAPHRRSHEHETDQEAVDKELLAESVQLDTEIEEEIRGMNA